MTNESIATFISAIKDHRLLDDHELTSLADLQSQCTEPLSLAQQLMERGSLTRYQTEQIFRGDTRKLVLGQYILLEPVGEGGMGQVYKARHMRMKRIVALKVIRKEVAGDAFAMERFNQEIEAAGKLQHPNVVAAYDANEVDGTLFFVMEFVEGVDLAKLVHENGTLSQGLACECVRQASLGLQHAHENGLVHRDIKPSNMLLCYKDGVVKLLDLGLARLRERRDGKQLTATGMVMGTPDFISPEQARDSRHADIRSDLYSLGCTLYYLLSGQVPFMEGTFTEKLIKHTLEEPPALDQLRDGLAPEVVATVKKLMAKKPDDRFQTPAELAEVLAPFAQPQKTAEHFRPAKRDEELEPISHLDDTQERPSPAPIGGTLDVTARRQAARDGTEPLPNQLPSENVTRWPSLPPAQPGPKLLGPTEKLDAAGPQSSVGRGVLAVVAGAGLALIVVVGYQYATGGFGSGVAVVTPTQPETTPTTRPTVPATKPTPTEPKKDPPEVKKDPPEIKKDPPFKPPAPPPVGVIVTVPKQDLKSKGLPLRTALSRDGRWALAGWDFSLYRWDLDGRPIGVPERETYSPVNAAAVAPDGRVLLASWEEILQAGKQPRVVPIVALWNPATKEDLRTYVGHEKEVTCVAFSPQGNRALSGSEDQTVRLWDLRAEKPLVHVMREHKARVLAVAITPDGNRGLSAGRDNKVVLWDLDAGKLLHVFEGHTSFVTCLAVSRDGRYALSAGWDKRIILWDLEKKQQVRIYAGHEAVVWSVAFAPDGRRFLSCGADQSVRLWDVDATEHLHSFTEHKGAVLSVAFSADGAYALSISEDHAVRRWSLPNK
ncbi:MAG: serine/threonine protein kinase [Planctomycetia bacterium]|nr:serine/threonine protein kinase [Planctomycetia bacterium]